MCGKPMAWDFRMLYDSDRVFRILLDDFQSRLSYPGCARRKQVFPDTIGTDLARRAGTVMGGYSTRCKERSFSNAEFSGVWAYTPIFEAAIDKTLYHKHFGSESSGRKTIEANPRGQALDDFGRADDRRQACRS